MEPKQTITIVYRRKNDKENQTVEFDTKAQAFDYIYYNQSINVIAIRIG